MRKKAAKQALLTHLLAHPRQIIRRPTLEQIAHPYNPTLLLHELQRQDGWRISFGQVILDMIDVGDIPTNNPEYPDLPSIQPHDVIMFGTKPDPDAPGRWRLAKEIRHNARS